MYEKFNMIINYVVAALFLLCFIVGVFDNFGASLGFLIVGLMLLPPLKNKLDIYLRPLLKNKSDKEYGFIKFWIGFAILILFAIMFPQKTQIHDTSVAPQNAKNIVFDINEAKYFLASKGFVLQCNEYGCSTYNPYLKDENGSSITYNIEKVSETSNKIYLSAVIHNKTGRQEMNGALIELAKTLTKNAIHSNLSPEIIQALENYKTGIWDISGYTIEIKQEDWVTGLGSSVYFIISKNKEG